MEVGVTVTSVASASDMTFDGVGVVPGESTLIRGSSCFVVLVVDPPTAGEDLSTLGFFSDTSSTAAAAAAAAATEVFDPRVLPLGFCFLLSAEEMTGVETVDEGAGLAALLVSSPGVPPCWAPLLTRRLEPGSILNPFSTKFDSCSSRSSLVFACLVLLA